MNIQRSLGCAFRAVWPNFLAVAALGALASIGLMAADGLRAQVAGDEGAVSVRETGPEAYSQPIPGLSIEQRALFESGKAEFEQRWVVPFHIGGHWGRGPLSNGEMCGDCHAGGGRGRAPDSPEMPLHSMLVRLSVPGADANGGPLPHPVYGLQLQNIGVLGKVPEEGRARVRYTEFTVELAGGERVTLRKPHIEFHGLNYGPLGDGTLTSARVAPALIGVGLLEAVPENVLLEIAVNQQQRGFNGRSNRVRDVEHEQIMPGRFGHKANQPSLRQQVAVAFFEDIGVTSRVFPRENCEATQKICSVVPSGGEPELADSRLDALVFYLQALAAPEQRDRDDALVVRGETVFEAAQCSVCHVPALRTGDYPRLPQISNRVIHPYTDLLIHDLGDELADGRPEYLAGARDWRTPPLWGIGLSEAVNGNSSYLHDGRARSLTEAILWHAGEAQGSRDAFVAMRRQDRDALLAFLRSL
jgi:CxxC motif-containing protein (DUF1111 family)